MYDSDEGTCDQWGYRQHYFKTSSCTNLIHSQYHLSPHPSKFILSRSHFPQETAADKTTTAQTPPSSPAPPSSPSQTCQPPPHPPIPLRRIQHPRPIHRARQLMPHNHGLRPKRPNLFDRSDPPFAQRRRQRFSGMGICAILDDVACNRHFQLGDPEEGCRSGLRARRAGWGRRGRW